MENKARGIDTNEEQQSTMAIALSLATEINECCDSIEDVMEVLAQLDKILKVRF